MLDDEKTAKATELIFLWIICPEIRSTAADIAEGGTATSRTHVVGRTLRQLTWYNHARICSLARYVHVGAQAAALHRKHGVPW